VALLHIPEENFVDIADHVIGLVHSINGKPLE